MAKYSIERLSLTNIKHLQALYRAVFQKNISLDFLLKKYNTNFSGAEFIGYLAFAPDDSPAAFYGVLPCLFRINGQTILAAQSADTMTHPHHRREGLFLRLAQETYALAKQNHIELIFGFPNQNSLAGFVKLNWKFQKTPMKIFKIRANPIPFSKIIRKISLVNDAYRDFLKRRYHNKNQEVIFMDYLHDGLIKNRDFIDYKAYGKSYFIEIEEVRVWIKLDDALKIGYVEVEKITSVESLLKKINKIAFQAGCSQVIFMTSINTPLYKILSTVARPKDSFPIGFYKITDRELDFTNVQFEYCDIDIF